MYMTIADLTDYSYAVTKQKDIKISKTLVEAKLSLINELQDEDLTIIEDITSEKGWLYYAKAKDEKYDCVIEWRITEIKLNEYFGICG